MTVHKFNDVVANKCAKHNLYRNTQALNSKYQFSPQDHEQLEELDQMLTKILTKTDQKLAKYRTSLWLPALHQAFLEHRFWTVRLSQARTHRNFSTALEKIAAQMNHPPATTGSLSGNLRKAQHKIREIKKAATQHCEAHLQELLEVAQQTNDKGCQKLIHHLHQAEYNRKCFNLHCQYMKPRMARGLMQLLIPDKTNPGKWQTIINPTEMEHHLIEYCQEHFKQAHGSPYMIPPLSTLLNYDSLTEF